MGNLSPIANDESSVEPFSFARLDVADAPCESAFLRVEYARAYVTHEQVEQLESGSPMELDTPPDEVTLFANGLAIATGQIVTRNGKISVQVTNLLPSTKQAHA